MKNKFIEVPGHYILDRLDIYEIQAAFKDNMSKFEKGQLPKAFDNQEWKFIYLNKQDLFLLADTISALYITLTYKESKYELVLRQHENLPKNEIMFF